MSREAATRRKGVTRSKPPGDRGGWSSGRRSWFTAAGLIGLGSLLASCGGGAGGSQPTVLESAPPPTEVSPTASTAEEGSGESSEPGEDETDEAEPIPASSEGPAQNWPEPEIPEAIYEPTEEGAEALIQYWFDARHHARVTGEVKPWNFATHDGCDVCQVMIKRIGEVYPSGWYVGENDELVELHVRLEGDRVATGLFTLDQASFKSYWQGELRGETPPESEAPFALGLSFDDERWQASELTALEGRARSNAERGGLNAD